MRAIWTGSLSFGLVNIPVRLYGASMERVLNFKLLDKHDLSPIRYRKVSDGHEIEHKNIVRAYETDGHYVVLDDEDFKLIDAKKVGTIDIVQFTDPKGIDPVYYDKPYYIEPQKKSVKAYALLRDALRESGTVAIARYVLRDKEHVGAILTSGRTLILEQLRYEDEIRSTRDLDLPQKSTYSEREMEMAKELIKNQTHAFEPTDFKNSYADELRKIIAEKARGRKPTKTTRETPVQPTDVSEILEMLKKSLRETQHSK